MLLTLFSHFYEWLRLIMKEEDSGPTPHLGTLSTATLDPTGCGHPRYTSMMNKPGHGGSEEVSADGLRMVGWATQTHRHHHIVQVFLLQPFSHQDCLFKFLKKKPELLIRDGNKSACTVILTFQFLWRKTTVHSVTVCIFSFRTSVKYSRSWSDNPLYGLLVWI